MALASVSSAADEPTTSVDPVVKQIQATADEFVAAFKKRDAKAMAMLWTQDCTLIDETNQVFQGREAVAASYAEFFKRFPGATIEIDATSVRSITPDTAVEDGTARISLGNGTLSSETSYTAVHVRKEGRWYMANVREFSVAIPPNVSRLKQLDWLVGAWESKGDDTMVRATYEWAGGGAFLKQSYAASVKGKETSQGIRVVAWDPQLGTPRSWSFDSSGGYGAGSWSETPTGWEIEWQGVLASGEETSSREILIRVPREPNLLGWRSVDRTAGGERLADTAEVVLDRVPSKP